MKRSPRCAVTQLLRSAFVREASHGGDLALGQHGVDSADSERPTKRSELRPSWGAGLAEAAAAAGQRWRWRWQRGRGGQRGFWERRWRWWKQRGW